MKKMSKSNSGSMWEKSLYSTILGFSLLGGGYGQIHADNLNKNASDLMSSSSQTLSIYSNQKSSSAEMSSVKTSSKAVSSSNISASSKISNSSINSKSSISKQKSSSSSVVSSNKNIIAEQSSGYRSQSTSKKVSSSSSAVSTKPVIDHHSSSNNSSQASHDDYTPTEKKVVSSVDKLFKDDTHTQLAEDVNKQLLDKTKKSLELINSNTVLYNEESNLVKKAEEMLYDWQLNGLGENKFGDISFHNDGSNELIININGTPHVYYQGKDYAEIDITTADGSEKYRQNFIGDQNYKISQTISLNNGDIIHIYHAEPTRLIVNKTELKDDLLNSKDFYYQFENGQLKNITDYTVLKNEINALFETNSNNTKLAVGITQDSIDELSKNLSSVSKNLTKEQINELKNLLSISQGLLNSAKKSGVINNNEIHKKDLYNLNTQSIKQTEAEGRRMGTHHDRQNLGIILTKGSSLNIRQINENFKGKLKIKLLGDDGKNELSATIVNSKDDWTTITAEKADLAVFVDTPWDTDGQATVEYEVISGTAKELPDFTYNQDQAAFIKQWNDTQAAYAIIEGYNIQLLAPIKDIKLIQDTDLNQLLKDYDEKLFPLYDSLTGIDPNKSYSDHIQGRYFVKANKDGVGSAYYGYEHTANNGDTIKPYLSMNWLPWHEIGHGYEFSTKDITLTDVFNNVYCTLFESKYTDDFKNQKGWIWGNHKAESIKKTIDQIQNGSSYSKGLGYDSRLIILYNLLSYDNANVMIRLNELNREFAVNKSQFAGQFGTVIAIVYAKYYNLNVIPYLNWVGIPVNGIVANEIEQQHYSIINSLCNMVSEDQITTAANKLGWNLEDNTTLDNSMALVTDSQLNNKTNKCNITVNIQDVSKIKNRYLTVYDGKKVIKKVRITKSNLSLGNLPMGMYTLVISGNDGWTFTDPYLKVTSDGTVNLNAINNYVLSDVKNIFQDDTFTKVKDGTTHQQIEDLKKKIESLTNEKQRKYNEQLLDKAAAMIDEIDISGPISKVATLTYNNDKMLHIKYYGGQPHYLFKGKKYIEIKVVNPNGQVVYDTAINGDQNYKAQDVDVPLESGSKIIVYDVEGNSNRYSVSDSRLKPEASKTYEYEVGADGKLNCVNS